MTSLAGAAPSRAFRSQAGGPAAVAANEVETSLQEVFETVRAGGRSSQSTELAKIEARVWQTFQALPKNAVGRLSPAAVRYVVHNFFATEHGWIIHGLEPSTASLNATELHGANILQDKAPALVEALLESRQSGRGLALDDVVVMIATLEHLVLHESASLLESSYQLNSKSSLEALERAEMEEVLQSYVFLYGQGSKAELLDPRLHQSLKAYLQENATDAWSNMVEYERDALSNYDFARRRATSPFGSPQYSFEAALQVAQGLAHGYGKWQNGECVDMKNALLSLDPQGNGRVSLGAFYSGTGGSTWEFSESVEMLRKMGALDETSRGGPKVLVANYLAQPTNCIASSAYYSVCCLNECEAVMTEIEHEVQAPTASAERLLRVVSGISSATVEAPRDIPRALSRKLHEVAAGQGGDVALHGRLFSQWLHFAFPNECAYPHTEEAGTLTASEWFESATEVALATDEERRHHIEAHEASRAEREAMATATATAKAAAPAEALVSSSGAADEAQTPHQSGQSSRVTQTPPAAQVQVANPEEDGESCSLEAWRDEERSHIEQPGRRPALEAESAAQPSAWRRAVRTFAQTAMILVVAKTAHAFISAGTSTKEGGPLDLKAGRRQKSALPL